MSESPSFAEFLRRVRSGDQGAAAELVRRYEKAVRIEVRYRLTDPDLCRVLDSMDVCQSVFRTFFVRAAAGQYDLDNAGQLLHLLTAITRNKVALAARRQKARRRGGGRVVEVGPARLEAVENGPDPSRIVAGEELLGEVRRRLSPEERSLVERRADGRAWAEIAAELGGTPEGRRKQLARALDRVVADLGLDDL
jgi:RNA polymerase sigma-70 factor (ECF subfamily)